MGQEERLQLPSAIGGLSTSSDSFDAEFAEVLWARARLIFVIGLVASAVVFIMNRIYGLEPLVGAMSPWTGPAHLLHPLSFAAGIAIVQFGKKTLARVQSVAFFIVAFNLIAIIPAVAVFYPTREPFLPVGLMLFATAAFLPCVQAQRWLAGAAIVTSAISQFVLPEVIPALGDYWAGRGARTAFFEHLWRVLGVTMIGVVSAIVSRSLYHLERSAHKAKRLGNYVIERELGKGGMGQVFVARHAMICRPTAVKVMKQADGDDPSALARFEREVQLSASLTHPNTITIFDFGRTADNTFYYAMEYLEGLDLQKMVEKFGPLPAERVIYLMRQVAGSLGEAHGRGIIHRDIKPSNVFITQRGGLYDFVKVLDFGLARQVRSAQETGLTKTGMVFGTPRYMAPETVYGAQKADGRSDLYNLGGVAYWLLTGRPLFASSSSIDLIIDHVKTVPEPPSAVSELPIPPELDTIIMKLLEKEPGERFQSAEALIKALMSVKPERSWSQDRAREWWDLHAPELVARAKPKPGLTPSGQIANLDAVAHA